MPSSEKEGSCAVLIRRLRSVKCLSWKGRSSGSLAGSNVMGAATGFGSGRGCKHAVTSRIGRAFPVALSPNDEGCPTLHGRDPDLVPEGNQGSCKLGHRTPILELDHICGSRIWRARRRYMAFVECFSGIFARRQFYDGLGHVIDDLSGTCGSADK